MPRKPKTPTTPLERAVLKDCLKWLNSQPHIWAWRRNVAATLIHGRYLRFGQPGMSDIEGIILVDGRGIHLEVEVKREGETPTGNQRAWLAAIAGHGGVALWAHSVAMLEYKLRHGFKRRGWKWGEDEKTQ